MRLSHEIRIREYSSWMYESFRSLSLGFTKDHPRDYVFHNQRIFEDIYAGYGSNTHVSRVALDSKGEVIAFRGAIPNLIQVPTSEGKYLIVPSVSLTGWLVKDGLGHHGVGMRLNMLIQGCYKALSGVCIGELSAKIFALSGGNTASALKRYVMPLELHGYRSLLSQPNCDLNLKSAERASRYEPRAPNDVIDADSLEVLWNKVSGFTPLFGLYRNKDYWRWRYKNCTFYDYLFFGDPGTVGIIVARVERVCDLNQPDRNRLKVLRLIEILPSKPEIWLGEFDVEFFDLLYSVLAWGRQFGCVAVDYQISSDLFLKFLSQVGFYFQEPSYNPSHASMAGLFRPFTLKPKPINYSWLLNDSQITSLFNRNAKTYFVKSDGAGDRPKTWPAMD